MAVTVMGVSAGIWVIHRGPKSGCKLVMLLGSYCDDGVSAGIWVTHTGPKSGCIWAFGHKVTHWVLWI